MAATAGRQRMDRLVVTRPAAEAAGWMQALQAEGWPAQALPLIVIGEPSLPAEVQALVQARAHWPQWDALMFVSSAAVKHFFAGACAVPGTSPVATRFWAPGPGTGRVLAQALMSLGVGSECIDAPPADAVQFDSEALWPVVGRQMGPGKRLLVVRGSAGDLQISKPNSVQAGRGREWLIEQCEAKGAHVDACVAYQRSAPAWSDTLRAQASAAAVPGSMWLLSSSEALTHLREGLPDVSWEQASALATHPRIAAAARDAGFGDVRTSRPTLPDVLRALESQWSPI